MSNSSRIASFSDCLKNELLFSDIKLAEVYENSVKIVKNRILEKTKIIPITKSGLVRGKNLMVLLEKKLYLGRL